MTDPLHEAHAANIRWTTNNFAEAIPGVPTPLTWSIWRHAMTFAAWDNWVRLGVVSRAEVAREQAAGTPIVGIFHGHVAGNIDVMSRTVARIPGYDPGAFEHDLFGLDPAATPYAPTRERWAVVAARAPVALAGHGRRLRTLRADTETWWRAAITTVLDRNGALQLLGEARQRFAVVLSAHSMQSQLGQALFDRLGKVAEAAGRPGLERRIVTGAADLEEVVLARDLWAHARKELDRDTFLARHGFHGPAEAELLSRSWREDPSPLDPVVDAFAAEPDDRSPSAMTARQVEASKEAERELLAASRRPGTRALIALARRHVPRREIGKNGFLMAVDVARHASRQLGGPDDVCFHTYEELVAGATVDTASRRSQRKEHLTVELPSVWTGAATPVQRIASEGVIRGAPVSPGRIEGTARVVLDPLECDGPVGEDEVLVARTTDPSWVTLFLTAAALVIDIGGPLSHGAIVARELGVPCVIGTGDGTSRIRTGDRIRVDGDAGTVQVLYANSPSNGRIT